MSSTAWYVWHKRVSGRNQATKLSLQNLFVNWQKKTFLSRVRERFYSSDRFVEFLRGKPAGGCGGGGGGRGEREDNARILWVKLRFLFSPIFLRDKIKDVASHFFIHFFSVTARLRRENALKMPNFRFMKNCKQATLFKPESGPKKSTPRKFAYISHFQWIGINATKFEKREFVLKVTLSSVAVVDAKAPYYGEYPSGDQFKLMFKLARLAKSHVNKAVCN